MLDNLRHALLRSLFLEKYLQKRCGLAAPRTGDRSYMTGFVRSWSRSHLTYVSGGCRVAERKLTSQSPSITVKLSVQYNLKRASGIHSYSYLVSWRIRYIGAGDLWFYSQAVQIRHSTAEGLTIAATFLRSYFAQTLTRGDGSRPSLHFSG